MSQAAQAITRPPAEVVRETPVSQAPNGICYAVSGEMNVPSVDVERMVSAVPKSIAGALDRKAYYFVPLTVNQGEETVIADRYDVALSDSEVCHRNLELGGSQCVFLSMRFITSGAGEHTRQRTYSNRSRRNTASRFREPCTTRTISTPRDSGR